ncbi:uncharacterized protein G2W53_017730 [Senna tora]|uniref:Uncharacterized protein n=1 Tax=Senna tora TaxID=362788 RepID=A0A834WP95_9FABA|nr:uncharacterized protein G2W53_017730 [Senna tora]
MVSLQGEWRYKEIGAEDPPKGQPSLFPRHLEILQPASALHHQPFKIPEPAFALQQPIFFISCSAWRAP